MRQIVLSRSLGLLSAFALVAGCGNDGKLPPPGGADLAGAGCTLDAQCAAPNPRCDKNTGACVPCLPERDNCLPGTHCIAVNGSYACTATCRDATDCPKSDAGAVLSCCGGSCIDTQSDRSHCGACDKGCAMVPNGDPACTAGVCGAACKDGFADCNDQLGDGCEIDTKGDVRHCGGCGKACPAVKNGAPSCQAGACGMTCDPGFAHCSQNPDDGCEANLGTDARNCGACGNACGALPHAQSACTAGACAIASCDAGFADCNKKVEDGCEVDLGSDLQSCGACGRACAAPNATATCTAGKCGLGPCNAGFADCDALPVNGCEVQIDGDARNCGACGRSCSAPNGVPACVGGVCGIASCSPGFADCNGNKVDGCETRTATDPLNCGGCGKACGAVQNGTAGCVNATCAVASCKFGFADCDMNFGNGCEADLLTPQTCGSCNIQCPVPAHATAGCGAGMCGIGVCDALWGDCDKSPVNGCERSLQTDAQNCGACGRVCAVANASPACVSGACAVGVCNGGFADCDGQAQNGCEIATSGNVLHCGSCGNVCPGAANAVPACAAGKCGVSCNLNFGNCDGMAGNGCEVDLLTSVANCSLCGNACPGGANAVAVCAAARCGLSCNVGFANCDGSNVNGCERNLLTDPQNCGACARVCVVPNASAACGNGACAVGVCSAGFADCDGQVPNGCEIATSSNVMNCGACGNVCPGGANALPACAASKCGLTCNAGFGNCDGMAGNGCEQDLLSDVNNCGSCNGICGGGANAVPACAAGKCGLTCNNGFGNCDASNVNGCERNLLTDPLHCGACGKACSLANAVAGCMNGGCVIASCNAGFADCDGNPANGCEINTRTDAKNCGACGNACGGGNAFCNAGVCGMCNPNVLVVGDNMAAANNLFVTALKNAGLNPTLVQDNYTYAGVPSAANYSAVVVLVGNQYNNDMAAAGQTSIVNAQAGGAGVVLVEWAAYMTGNGRWNTLRPLTLISRNSGGSAKATVTLTVANHPLWTGLPNSFAFFNTMGFSTVSALINGGTQIASCTECLGSGVAVRDNGVGGRLVHVSIALDYTPGDQMWSNDANGTRLMTNAVAWAARCL